MSSIGFIGTGHIAAPMARILARRGHTITVTRRNTDVSARLAADIGAHVADPQDVLDRTDIVFLCLRPHVADQVLAPLTFRDGQQIVSVMAGIARADLLRLCAPATDMVQTIPLGFLEQGGCPLAAHGNTALLSALFAPENPIVPVTSEPALNAHFAICAMVPGILDLMATGADWLARQTGAPSEAEFYTTQLLSGFLATMERAPGQLGLERDALATAGTLSLQMVEGLRAGQAHGALSDTLDAIGTRLDPDA